MWRWVTWVARFFGADEQSRANRAAGRARAAARGETRRTYPVGGTAVADVIRAEVWVLAAHRGWTDAVRDAAVDAWCDEVNAARRALVEDVRGG